MLLGLWLKGEDCVVDEPNVPELEEPELLVPDCGWPGETAPGTPLVPSFGGPL